MAASTTPKFLDVARIEWGATAIATANTAKDGTGTVLTAFTGEATDGSWVRSMRFRSAGTNIATVARVFINNGAANSTPANNILFDEITLPATTLSETGALYGPTLALGFWLPAGYKLNVTLGTTVATGYYVSVVGGDY